MGKRDVELIDSVLYEKQEKVIKKRKRIKILKRVLVGLAFVFMVPLFLISLVSKITGDALYVSDKGLMVIATGSMSEKSDLNKEYLETNNLHNQFNAYDIIIIESVESEAELKQYDVIAFKIDDGRTIVHRIKEIKVINGVTTYITQGDAENNAADDGYRPTFDQVVGKYTNQKIDGIGIFVIFLQSPSGLVTLIAVIYCLVMMDKQSNKVFEEERKRVEMLENAIRYSNKGNKEDFHVEYKETIYYQGYAYEFDDSGFVDKKEVESKYDQDKMIKVITDLNEVEVSSDEIELPSTKENLEE